jgi:hypothetical protein
LSEDVSRGLPALPFGMLQKAQQSIRIQAWLKESQAKGSWQWERKDRIIEVQTHGLSNNWLEPGGSSLLGTCSEVQHKVHRLSVAASSPCHLSLPSLQNKNACSAAHPRWTPTLESFSRSRSAQCPKTETQAEN